MMPPKKEGPVRQDEALEAANFKATLSPLGEKVKAEARAHRARQIAGSVGYYLRIGRARFVSWRKGAK